MHHPLDKITRITPNICLSVEMPEIMRPGSDWPVMRALYPVQLLGVSWQRPDRRAGFQERTDRQRSYLRCRTSPASSATGEPGQGSCGAQYRHGMGARPQRRLQSPAQGRGGSPVPPRIGKQRIRQVISRGGGRHPWIPARARRNGDDGNAERDVDAQACRLGVAGCQPAASPGGLPRSLVIFPDATLTIAASAMIVRRPER